MQVRMIPNTRSHREKPIRRRSPPISPRQIFPTDQIPLRAVAFDFLFPQVSHQSARSRPVRPLRSPPTKPLFAEWHMSRSPKREIRKAKEEVNAARCSFRSRDHRSESDVAAPRPPKISSKISRLAAVHLSRYSSYFLTISFPSSVSSLPPPPRPPIVLQVSG